MTTAAANLDFGKWRSMFWPIRREELRKFIPMFLIYALIVFNYSILRATKDSLLITAPSSGAAAIPYIKVWAILPMAFLSTLIFTRLSNRYNREKVFYSMMFSFLGFFLIFAFVLYPLRMYLHPHALADSVQAALPIGMQGLVAIFRNWTFTLFYVMCELWSTLIMTVLFWGFANEVTSVKEAKRFYTILGVGANIATIVAGQVGIFISGNFLNSRILFGGDRWGQSLILICSLIVVVGLFIVAIYRWLSHNVLRKEIVESKPLGEGTKIKMGIRKNFAYLAKSRYLICIAIIVLTYNISLNMIEVVWKDQVQLLYPYGPDYNIYMSKVLTYVGITSTLFGLLMMWGQVMKRFGWTANAYVTPAILLVTGMLFFIFLLFRDAGVIGTISGLFGMMPLALCALFGSMQNSLSRASKFTFFDVTKEMSFIPLSKESKLKGKAAIDGVGSRLGKSGGSILHQFLLLIFGTVSMSTPYIAVIFLGVIFAWFLSVRSLGQQCNKLSESHEKLEISEESEPTEDDANLIPSAT